jgi:hypothetical protein
MLEYRFRPDSAADFCPRCSFGYSVPKPRWITLDAGGSPRWLPCDSVDYSVSWEAPEIIVRLSLPAQRIIEIYQHTDLDDYRGTPFRLIAVQVQSDSEHLAASGGLVRTLFRKHSKFGYVLTIPARSEPPNPRIQPASATSGESRAGGTLLVGGGA